MPAMVMSNISEYVNGSRSDDSSVRKAASGTTQLSSTRSSISSSARALESSFLTIESQQKKLRVNRPKALCFDYGMLKEKYSINLETSTVSENDLDVDDAPQVATPTAPPKSQQEELPF